MKKNLLVLTLFFLYLATPHLNAYEVWVEGKAAYFYPTSHKFRSIYKDRFIWGADITVPFCNKYALWFDADYYKSNGKSIGLGDHTKIELIPLGAGVKYFMPLTCIYLDNAHFYLGAGINYLFLKVHNDSNYVQRHVSKNGIGWIAKAGIMVNLPNNCFLDVFANYMNSKVTFHKTHQKADLSSVSVGMGLGYKFGCNNNGCLFNSY